MAPAFVHLLGCEGIGGDPFTTFGTLPKFIECSGLRDIHIMPTHNIEHIMSDQSCLGAFVYRARHSAAFAHGAGIASPPPSGAPTRRNARPSSSSSAGVALPSFFRSSR